ncbi:hypothetical protein K431DRAFT_288477 [Polychaeton citri CBS 116435]|uniref:Uncharacterized protein n=1 Tax=Polychaeton citri CBS 116435 TaxID=1314669 RepID=A0A9P4UJ27_9PEZI|nr:hypothetical protein K431DRAFT_288477 [Polychaeton citri CBS 116435]
MACDDNDSSSWPACPSRRCDKDSRHPPQDYPPSATTHSDGSSSRSGDGHNPFVTFKRFIDNTFKTLDDGIRQLPSNMAELKERVRQERLRQAQEEIDVERRWLGSGDLIEDRQIRQLVSARLDRDSQREAVPWCLQLLRQARDINKDVPVRKVVDLYRDDHWWSAFGDLDRFASPMLSLGGACYYLPETGDNLPSTASWRWSSPHYRWLSVDWFKRSPYSPITLEHHPDLQSEGVKWRAAFEDLLSASLDKPMTSHDQYGYRPPHGSASSTWHGCGLDWMLSLQCRGILPPQLPSIWQRRFGLPIDQKLSELDIKDHAAMGRWPSSDFQQLIQEIATPSRSEDEAIASTLPLPEERQIQDFNDDTWPRDEQALYESYPFADHIGVQDEKDVDDDDDDNDHEQELEQAWHLPGFGISSMLQSIQDMEKDFARIQSSIHREQEQEQEREQKQEHERPQTQSQSQSHSQPQWQSHKEMTRRSTSWVGTSETDQGVSEVKPKVVSSTTSTHTTRLPDGTVTTKVVVKQCFADGREETHESVQTMNESEQAVDAQSRDPAAKEQRSKGGWFWR